MGFSHRDRASHRGREWHRGDPNFEPAQTVQASRNGFSSTTSPAAPNSGPSYSGPSYDSESRPSLSAVRCPSGVRGGAVRVGGGAHHAGRSGSPSGQASQAAIAMSTCETG